MIGYGTDDLQFLWRLIVTKTFIKLTLPNIKNTTHNAFDATLVYTKVTRPSTNSY